MKDGLYIDAVSKTIISKLSESIAEFVGDSLSKEVKKLLLTKFPGIIGDEIMPVVSKAQKDAQKSAQTTEKKILDQIKALDQLNDIKGQVDESVRTRQELLQGHLSGILDKIGSELTSGMDGLKGELADLQTAAKGMQGQTLASFKEIIEKNAADRLEKAAHSDEKLAENFSAFLDRVEKSAERQSSALSEALQGDMRQIGSELTDGLTGLQQAIETSKENAREVQDKILVSFNDSVEDNKTVYLKVAEKSEKNVLARLQDIQGKLTDNSREQKRLFEKSLDGYFKQNGTEVGASFDNLQVEIAGLKDITQNSQTETLASLKESIEESVSGHLVRIDDKLRNELESIRSQMEETSREQSKMRHELLQVDFKKMNQNLSAGFGNLQKQITALKDNSSKSHEKDLALIKKFLENELVVRITEIQQSDRKLWDELISTRKQAEENAKEQNGLLASIVYSTKKLSKASAAPAQDVMKRLEASLEKVETDVSARLELVGEHHKELEKELAKIRSALEANGEEGRSDLLNSIYYSIKKLNSAHKKDQDISQKFESKFMAALDELYGHIRHLEEDKEDLFTEIIRVAGNDFTKHRLDKLEKELEQANQLAEKYQKEKQEVEARFDHIQSLWEKQSS